MRIQHNIMAMNAYRNYTNNTKALSKNLEKLSSGYKINRAGDDAAGLAISEKMRAQITGLKTAQKNAKDGISLVQTAEGALTEVHSMLNRMVELADQSANGTYDDAVDRANLQKEFDALRTEIDRIADSSNFNGIKLLDGSLSGGTGAGSVAVNVKYGSLNTNPGVLALQAADPAGSDIAATGTSPTLVAGTNYSFEIEFLDASGAYQKKTVTFEAGHADIDNAGNEDPLAAAISDALGSGFTVEVTAGAVAINANDAGAQNQFKVLSIGANLKNADTGATVAGNAFGAVTNTAGADAYYNLDVAELGTYTGASSENVEDFVIEINGEKFAYATAAGATALGQLDPSIHVVTVNATPATGDRADMITLINNKTGIAADDTPGGTLIALKAGAKAGTNGNGLTLQIGDTSESFNQLTVSVADMHARALGISGISIADQASAQSAVESLKDAINSVSSTRGGLGALQNRLEHTINNLSVMQENIQDAEATIRDVDVAEEMMTYTKNTILVQSAQAMLAQANQVPQGVLQLLQ